MLRSDKRKLLHDTNGTHPKCLFPSHSSTYRVTKMNETKHELKNIQFQYDFDLAFIFQFSVLLIIIFILELAAGISGYVLRDRTEAILTGTLTDSLSKYKDDKLPQFTALWDDTQRNVLLSYATKYSPKQNLMRFFCSCNVVVSKNQRIGKSNLIHRILWVVVTFQRVLSVFSIAIMLSKMQSSYIVKGASPKS